MANFALFSPAGGDRGDKPNVLVVITDGKTNRGSRAYSSVLAPLVVSCLYVFEKQKGDTVTTTMGDGLTTCPKRLGWSWKPLRSGPLEKGWEGGGGVSFSLHENFVCAIFLCRNFFGSGHPLRFFSFSSQELLSFLFTLHERFWLPSSPSLTSYHFSNGPFHRRQYAP